LRAFSYSCCSPLPPGSELRVRIRALAFVKHSMHRRASTCNHVNIHHRAWCLLVHECSCWSHAQSHTSCLPTAASTEHCRPLLCTVAASNDCSNATCSAWQQLTSSMLLGPCIGSFRHSAPWQSGWLHRGSLTWEQAAQQRAAFIVIGVVPWTTRIGGGEGADLDRVPRVV
jgi:hypothetical protein